MKLLFLFLLITNSLHGVDFNKDIKPILARKCFSCHGPQKQKGKLRLDNRTDALKAITSTKGPSDFMSRIKHNDPDEIMPPSNEGSLSDNEIKLLENWIVEGAKYEKHWAFQAVRKTKAPSIQSKWSSNEIDKFILKKLTKLNQKPQDVVFDYNLLKRISFKLTGLPPNEKDLQGFKNGQLSYEEYVKQLIDSPGFGESMATFWLDGARYADTNGIEHDNSRPIWPYRDWVIQAFNKNMPYNQFITEQIAGDLLPNSTLSQNIATGFLRCNITTNEMGAIEEEFQTLYAKDRLNTTMASITGLTISCAECHDHKYDPISQKEYYQLLAYFNNIDGKAVGFAHEPANEPVVLTDTNKYKRLLKLKTEKQAIEKQLSSIRKNKLTNFHEWWKKNLNSPSKALYQLSQFELFFSFDETDNADIINIINDQKGDLRGALHRVNGKNEQALKGSTSFYIDCPRTSVYDQKSKFSAGFWIKPDEHSNGEILGQFYNFKGWKIEINDGFIIFTLSNSKDSALKIQSKNRVPKDIWTHVTFTYHGETTPEKVKLFLNEQNAETKIIQNNLEGSSYLNAVLRVGSYLDNAAIDDVFITKTILSQENISLIANFNAASRLVHYKSPDLNSLNTKRLENYYFETIDEDYSLLSKRANKITDELNLLMKYNTISMVMKEKPMPVETNVLIRGDYQKKGEKVTRKTPDFVNQVPTQSPNNRLGLAKWLTHPQNPLTSRVIVNRIWLKLFNKGLIETPDDLGIQGDYPTHPLLLDFLSSYLIQNNWDIKKLVELIVHSSTFKQKSQPGIKFESYNTYPKHRLKAEEIRDQLLVYSKLLNDKLGGAPVFPYQPAGLWVEITSDSSDTKHFEQSTGDDNYRRSIYTFWKRSLPPPSMIIFDSPNRQVCSLTRQETNTPLQSLSLMNDPQFTDLYKVIINNFGEHTNKEEKIRAIFKRLLLREPGPQEIEITKSLKTAKDISIFIHAILNTDEFITIK